MPFLLLAIVSIAFVISRVVPANPLSTVLSQRELTNPDAVAAAKSRWGLDHSLLQQYLTYMSHVLRGDLGVSFRTKGDVRGDLFARLPATLELTAAALLIAVVGGVAIGILVATRPNRLTDHVGRLFSLIGSSLPLYWSGLILLLIFYAHLGWLPGPGRLDPRSLPPGEITGFYTVDSLLHGQFGTWWEAVRHLVLPAFVLGWWVMGIVSRIVRASMLDALTQDYVRTARAKGVRESVVLFRHAFRNALIPAMTIVGYSAAYLITGAVFVEVTFDWPGIGSYAVASAESLDFPGIMGVALLGGAFFLIANLVTDVGYALADPQIRLS
jgi:peptide/nickel transport system permease protein